MSRVLFGLLWAPWVHGSDVRQRQLPFASWLRIRAAVRRSAVAGAARGLEGARRPPGAPGALVGPARPPPGRAAASRAHSQETGLEPEPKALPAIAMTELSEEDVDMGSMMVWDERLKEGDKARVCITMAYRQKSELRQVLASLERQQQRRATLDPVLGL